MSEIRVTFDANDFGAISQALVKLGVGFSVEPIEKIIPDTSTGRASPPAMRQKKPAKKSAGKRSAKRAQPGADRLRDALARNQSTTEPAAFAATERSLLGSGLQDDEAISPRDRDT